MPRRAYAVLAIALGIAMSVLDGNIANVALPTIARQLQISTVQSIWVVNAYQLTIVLALLPLASLGDSIGYRRVYTAGLLVFTFSSLACALADSLPLLISARVFQGLGAAGMMSVNTALVRFTYPPRLLGQGIGINAMVVAASAVLGPSIATAILAVGNWPWLFAVNLPIGVIALATARSLPEPRGSGARLDLPSILLNALTFGLLVTAIDALGHGRTMGPVALQIGVAGVIGCVLVLRQRNRPAPLLPIDLLQHPIFALSITASICAFAAQMLAFVSLPFELLGALHRNQMETGLLMTPWPLAVAIVAPLAGRLADHYSPGALGGIGLMGFATGLASLALLPVDPSNADIAWRMALCGIGFALFQSPNNRTIINAAPEARSGGASGMLGMGRLLGQSCGAALVALAFGRFLADGTRVSLWTGCGFALVAALASSLRPRLRV